jgi:hypothetical protein
MYSDWVGQKVRVKGHGNLQWTVEGYHCDEQSWSLRVVSGAAWHYVDPAECTPLNNQLRWHAGALRNP